MKSESIAYVIAGICFGIILGWVIGTQQARRPAAVASATTTSAQPAAGATAPQQAPRLDEGRVQALNTILQSDPKNVNATIQLGNVYFDAERWDDAAKWYEKALELDPKNADASTDLGVSYYYSNKPDQALAQFGKQDLKAAATEWQKVVELAPDSPEGQAARRALEGIASAHANPGSTPSNP